jgi:hypothetical protein
MKRGMLGLMLILAVLFTLVSSALADPKWPVILDGSISSR